ncbi:MAG: AAA family ATPase [Acidobacteriia bacterium]|nr:AAA family ATPase [Terriglobia bacterium]
MEIILKDVRSLCGSHRIPLKPLTLLVGENSTGKSTFLAMVAHVNQLGYPSTRPTFNIPPFDLGTYDSIATYKGGRYGRADSFSVGFSNEEKEGERTLVVTYASHRGQPQVKDVEVSSPFGQLSIQILQESHTAHVNAKFQGGRTLEFDVDMSQLGTQETDVPFYSLLRLVPDPGKKAAPLAAYPDLFLTLVRMLRRVGSPVLALAPVRTQPRRTYDEFSEEFDPEGDHVPVLLARLWQEDEADKATLMEALNKFGVSSALYKRISVRRLGRRPTDPFQILVTMAGPPVNIPDVGYGVSQALPIVVQSVLAGKEGMLLLQQPEVHLHPRAQAALGSFFAQLVASEKKHLVIETHSDYLLDRVRLEVAQGTLPADKVQILFFEKLGIETVVHQIRLDKHGNVEGAPGSYRRFFLEEEENLFSRAEE